MLGSFRDKDKGWSRIVKAMKEVKGSYVKVGILEKAGSTDDGKMTMARLGAVNEFGSPEKNIPPRPFMLQAYERCKGKIIKLFESEKNKIIAGKSDTERSLNVVGEYFKGEVQREFTEGNFTPNAPSTLLANWRKHHKGVITKGEALENDTGFGLTKRPLIDTGRLRQSINYQAVKK